MNEENIDLIIKKAAERKSDEHYKLFFNTVRRKELFFNLINSEQIGSNDDELKVPTVSVGDNLNAVVFYTSAQDDRLSNKHAGIVWEKGLEMVSKMTNANGIIIQSSSDAWIAIAQEKIDEILSPFKPA